MYKNEGTTSSSEIWGSVQTVFLVPKIIGFSKIKGYETSDFEKFGTFDFERCQLEAGGGNAQNRRFQKRRSKLATNLHLFFAENIFILYFLQRCRRILARMRARNPRTKRCLANACEACIFLCPFAWYYIILHNLHLVLASLLGGTL